VGLAACTAGTDGTDGEALTCPEEGIVLTDAENYAYIGTLDVPSVTTTAATDAEVCWNNVTSDLQCHSVDPVLDIDNMSLIRFPYATQEEVEAGLSEDDLFQSDISGYVEFQPGDSMCANLADLSFFGSNFEISEEYTEEGGTYLMLLTTGTITGVGARVMTFLEPDAASDNTDVDFPDGCGLLEVDIDLEEMEALPICSEGPWTFEWDGLTLDGLGNDINLDGIDQVMVGFYAGLTRQDLEVGFLDIELISDDIYEINLDGEKSVDLVDAVLRTDGVTLFDGFERDVEGQWLIALRCTTCYNPAPLYLTFLEPR
jgi:hypothetical protein